MDAADAPAATSLRLTALTVADAALALSRSGHQPVTEEMLRQDIEAGAPVNRDGTINLVQYAAWLVRSLAHGD